MAGGKGGSGSGGTTQQTSTTELPGWVTQQAQQDLANANTVANNMLGPYQGATYAQITPGTQADIAGMQSLVGSTQPATNAAMGTLNGLTSFAAPQINAPTLAGTNLSAYMNPYADAVTQSGLNAIDMQRKQALTSNADQAIAQGAFGGSRQGVQEGITNAAAATAAGNLAAQTGLNNFQNAEQMAQYDIGNNLNTQSQNVGNRLSAAGLNANAANMLSGVATQGLANNETALQNAIQGQALSQQDKQNMLNADQQAYQAAQQFPIQQLQIPASILSQTPYGSTTKTQGQTSYPDNSGAQTAGTIMQGIGTIGSMAAMFF
jgi:hypothetical protein